MDNDFIRVSCVIRPEEAYRLVKDGSISSVSGTSFEINAGGVLSIYSRCDPSVVRKFLRVADVVDWLYVVHGVDYGDPVKKIGDLHIVCDDSIIPRRLLEWIKDTDVSSLALPASHEAECDLSQHSRIRDIHYGYKAPKIQHIPITLKRFYSEQMNSQYCIQLLNGLPNLEYIESTITDIKTESALIELCKEIMKHPMINGISRVLLPNFPVTLSVLDVFGFHPTFTYIEFGGYYAYEWKDGHGSTLEEAISERCVIARKRRPLFYATKCIKGDLLRVLNEYLGL